MLHEESSPWRRQVHSGRNVGKGFLPFLAGTVEPFILHLHSCISWSITTQCSDIRWYNTIGSSGMAYCYWPCLGWVHMGLSMRLNWFGRGGGMYRLYQVLSGEALAAKDSKTCSCRTKGALDWPNKPYSHIYGTSTPYTVIYSECITVFSIRRLH